MTEKPNFRLGILAYGSLLMILRNKLLSIIFDFSREKPQINLSRFCFDLKRGF